MDFSLADKEGGKANQSIVVYFATLFADYIYSLPTSRVENYTRFGLWIEYDCKIWTAFDCYRSWLPPILYGVWIKDEHSQLGYIQRWCRWDAFIISIWCCVLYLYFLLQRNVVNIIPFWVWWRCAGVLADEVVIYVHLNRDYWLE